jgi:hypothetical protein
VSPGDIDQGALGDCWFLAALAVLAEEHNLIKNIIMSDTYNDEGVYQLRFCDYGKWQIVIIDDYFPVSNWGSFCYTKAKSNELWPALIEKGMAKLFGGYQALVSGMMAEAFAILTGAPTKVNMCMCMSFIVFYFMLLYFSRFYCILLYIIVLY